MNQSYGRLVSRAAIAATVMASCLLLIKIFAWWYTGSVSILAALVDSLMDIAASLTNLLVVRYSLQPADEEHTFGHGKAESLAALAQSMFISGSALFLFLTGIQHLVSPSPMNDPGVGVVVTDSQNNIISPAGGTLPLSIPDDADSIARMNVYPVSTTGVPPETGRFEATATVRINFD